MAKRGPAITGLHSQGIIDDILKAATKKVMRKSTKAIKAEAVKQTLAKKAAAAAKKAAQDNAYEKMLQKALSKNPKGTVSGSEIMDMGRRAKSYYRGK